MGAGTNGAANCLSPRGPVIAVFCETQTPFQKLLTLLMAEMPIQQFLSNHPLTKLQLPV